MTGRKTPDAVNKAAADYTPDELVREIEKLHSEFFAAVRNEPEPDIERAKATLSKFCQPDEEEYAKRVGRLRNLLSRGLDLSVNVIAVTRLPERDDAAIALTSLLISGEQVFPATRSLMVFEDGRWIDGDCEEARAQMLGEDFDADFMHSSISASVSLSDNPADHTEEQIARSFEYVNKIALTSLLYDSPVDMEAVRAQSIKECQSETDEEIIELSKDLRERTGYSQLDVRTVGVLRLDDTRAWVSGHIEVDGTPFIYESTPSLVTFEDGQWRRADCLRETDPDIVPPDHI